MVEIKQLHPILLTWVHLLLLLLLVQNHGAEAQSPIQPVPAFGSNHSWEWDPSAAVIIITLIGTFLFVAIFSIYISRFCTDQLIPQRNPIGATADWPCSCSQGIDPQVLDTFPILFYSTIKDLKIGKGTLECAVCLSEFKDNETLRLLPKCSHVFHPDCIDAWLSSHVTCPVCRANLNQDVGEVAIAVALSLTNEEGSGSRGELGGGENENEQYPLEPNANEGQRNADEDDGKRNRASKSKLLGKLPRSNSTGHSLVEPGKCLERYTLRLPEDVRKYIMLNHGIVQRSVSYNVVMPMGSRKGLCWSDSDGSSRGKRNGVGQERLVLSRMQPFVGLRSEGSVTGNSSNTCSVLPGLCS